MFQVETGMPVCLRDREAGAEAAENGETCWDPWERGQGAATCRHLSLATCRDRQLQRREGAGVGATQSSPGRDGVLSSTRTPIWLAGD